MRIFNKFVENKTEPSNKSDIWFDGKVLKMYKEGEWQPFTPPLDAVHEITKIIEEDKSILQGELKKYLKIEDSPFEKGSANNSVVLKGSNNQATGIFSTAFGGDNIEGATSPSSGNELLYSKAEGYASHAEGAAHAIGRYSHAEGGGNKIEKGYKTVPTAEGAYSHAEGTHTYAKGVASHAEGELTIAEGNYSHVEGRKTKTIDSYAHAEGLETSANGSASHAEGSGSVASDTASHAEGRMTNAGGKYSHAEGQYTKTSNQAEHASGKFNVSTKSSDASQATHFSIGIGTSESKRKNAFEVKQNGDIYVEGVDDCIQKHLNTVNELDVNKANTSGRYPEMSVGFADDLVGRGESVPAEFSFRASGGKSIKDGRAYIKRLKGNSVVWNQWAKPFEEAYEKPYNDDGITYNGNKVTIDNWRSYQPFRFDIKCSTAKDHLYLVLLNYANTNPDQLIYIEFGGENSINRKIGNIAYFHRNIIYNNAYKDTFTLYLANTLEGTVTLSDLQVIDLTLMFGAGNEPTTIEEYEARKPIVADEYACNEGEVIHMTAEGIKSIGDNAWDEEWELGFIDPTNGNESSIQDTIRSKNFNKIIGGENYVVLQDPGGDMQQDSNCTIVLYDEDKNFIDFWGIPEVYRELSIDSRARYFKVAFKVAYGTQYKNDVMISLMHSGWKADTDAKYQPYWEDRLMFDKRIKDEFPDGMSKWDMVYNKNGKGYIVKGMGVVEDMSQWKWEKNTDGRFQAPITGALLPPNVEVAGKIMCNRYVNYSALDTYYGLIGISLDSNGFVWVRDDAYTDVASFKASLQGVPLFYQLAEPTIIEYDEPFNLDYKVADFGTEEIIAPQPSAPLAADIIYQFNAVDMIREHELEINELQKKINEGNNNSSNVTPDWNAKVGEAGYIENRTHGIIWYYKPEDVNFNDLLLRLKNKTPEIIIEDSFTKATYKQVNELEDMVINGVKFFEKTDVNTDNYLHKFTDTFLTDDGTNGSFKIDYDDNGDVYITIQWDNSTGLEDVNAILNGINRDYYIIDPTNFNIFPLDSAYLPNTVLKTTPQTLSSADKNQVLANLGIDPVVWKYMCNPHIVELDRINYEFNNAIPKELSNIIYQNGRFNHLVLSTILIKIYEESEGGDVFWRVERITSYNNYGNVIFDGEEFGYNTDTRLFLV